MITETGIKSLSEGLTKPYVIKLDLITSNYWDFDAKRGHYTGKIAIRLYFYIFQHQSKPFGPIKKKGTLLTSLEKKYLLRNLKILEPQTGGFRDRGWPANHRLPEIKDLVYPISYSTEIALLKYGGLPTDVGGVS